MATRGVDERGSLSMNGRVCLVTGGTSGVGASIARGCARLGANVVLVGRDGERTERAARALRDSTGNPHIESLAADLAEPDSVRRLAGSFRSRHRELHLLSNNAATLRTERRVNSLGHESIFATNYLGHFLLTYLLFDLLKASAPSRVLTVSGQPLALAGARLDFDDLMLEKGFNALRATRRAALAKVLFTMELAHRTRGSGLCANTYHPGIVKSGLPRDLPWFLRIPATLALSLAATETRTGIYLASSPEVQGVTGGYFVDGRQRSFRPGFDAAAAGARLWVESERLLGL
jgi:retinol dehydrogenase 12